MKKKRIIFTMCVTVLLSLLIVWIVWGNTALECNTHIVANNDLPGSFDGYRIAHISDLHNAEVGKDNTKLLNLLRDTQPDIIVITGDLIDSRNTNIDIALHFASEALKIAPCYYVAGNHEARIVEYADFKENLTALGVVVLDNAVQIIENAGESITLLGINDPSFQTDYSSGDDTTIVQNRLSEMRRGVDNYSILLSHRPELFDIYVENEIDLVFSGHAHGGQIRLPFIGGLVAPNQGLFPKYDTGIYTKNNTSMVVSRGIGNSLFPLRFNNRPEVLLIELKAIQ